MARRRKHFVGIPKGIKKRKTAIVEIYLPSNEKNNAPSRKPGMAHIGNYLQMY
jgi:hypothetical protein